MKKIIIILLVILTENGYCQLKLEGEDLKNVRKAFYPLLAKGDSCFSIKKYEYAKGYYSNAFDLVFGYEQKSVADSISNYNEIVERTNKKFKLLNDLIWQEELNNIDGAMEDKYNKYLKLGDRYVNHSNARYTRSLQAYSKAFFLKPNEKYPLEQIASIERKLYEVDSLQMFVDEAICDAEILIYEKKYTEAEVYLKSQLAVLQNGGQIKLKKHKAIELSLSNQLNALQVEKNISKEKYDEEKYRLQLQIQSNAMNKGMDEAMRKSFYEMFAKYLANIQMLKTGK